MSTALARETDHSLLEEKRTAAFSESKLEQESEIPHEPVPGDLLHDGLVRVQQAAIKVQETVLDIQRVAINTDDVNLRLQAIRLQQAAAEILKGAVTIQQGGLVPSLSEMGTEDETNPVFHNATGSVLLGQRRLADAAVCFRRALALKPDYLDALKNLADTLMTLGELDEAIAVYRNALNAHPEATEVNNNLGIALLGKDQYEEAREVFHQLLLTEHGLPGERQNYFKPLSHQDALEPLYASQFKLTSWIEQLDYLLDKKLIDFSFRELVDSYRSLLLEIEADPSRIPYTPITDRQLKRFGGYFDKVIHYADAPRLAGSTMNGSLDYKSIEEEYFRTRALYFDDFLTPAALTALRRFFLESTVFFRQSEAGFVGTYITDGFDCSLVFQLIAELRSRFPRVLENRPLNNMWCYRYNSSGSGVKPHNGDGSVTINFWLTPDDANLGPAGGGGMVMYDKEHPADWDWLHVNMYKDNPDTQAKIAEYLADANSFVVPYRCNRAVLFHSTLFHKTDPFRFRDGHENRRMNITMLFGKRGQESAPLK